MEPRTACDRGACSRACPLLVTEDPRFNTPGGRSVNATERILLMISTVAGWAAIDVILRQIREVLLTEAALRLGARGHRFRHSHCDAGLIARHNLLAVEVAAIGDRLQCIGLGRRFGFLGESTVSCFQGKIWRDAKFYKPSISSDNFFDRTDHHRAPLMQQDAAVAPLLDQLQ
jgi:hypothetical protein